PQREGPVGGVLATPLRPPIRRSATQLTRTLGILHHIDSMNGIVYNREGASIASPIQRKDEPMRKLPLRWPLLTAVAGMLVLFGPQPPAADSACCYFSAKNADILQPAQKVFITWDPVEKVESFTVQPKFEGNAKDFGMVIPTPARPKLDEMPRDFFKE